METSNAVAKDRGVESGAAGAQTGSIHFIPDRVLYPLYGLALAVSISVWFIAIRAPLWLDETVSYYLIKGGFSEIMPRQAWPNVPVYSYILWLWTKIAGTGEISLRIPSILAMLGAVYLLYKAARELFDRDVAMIAAVIFCLHPFVIFAAIDVRTYGFVSLALTASILALVHLRHNNSNWLAALFGVSAAFTIYFHFLFGAILPALAICFFVVKIGDRKNLWRQAVVALAAFAVAFLPIIPELRYLLHTSGIHVFEEAPKLADLGMTLAPGWLALIALGAIFIAAATLRLDVQSRIKDWRILFCAALGFVPILILYGISVWTPVHIFVFRYRLVALPGIALCWALIVSRIDSRAIRLLFCLAVVSMTAYAYYSSPVSRLHGYSWKYALEFVEKNASADGAPVLICSDLPEADHMTMPVGEAVKDSPLFGPLSYYQVSVPVVALPRTLNEQAVRIGSGFLQEAGPKQQRFLAVGFEPSVRILQWLAYNASTTYYVHPLGVFDGITVLEFTPRNWAEAPH